MNILRTGCLIALSVLSSFHAKSQDPGYNTLTINEYAIVDGEEDIRILEFDLAKKPILNMQSGNHFVEYQGSTYSLDLSRDIMIIFETKDWGGIQSAVDCSYKISISDNDAIVYAVDRPANILVSTIAGVVIKRIMINPGESTSLDLPSLATGNYIVNVNGKSIKIAKP
ncbi:MAG: hypothetical protein NC405_06605 [Odoribacter sp.]|nr:hypothetical protein [Odoribacter sp.]